VTSCQQVFDLQRAAFRRQPNPPASARRAQLLELILT